MPTIPSTSHHCAQLRTFCEVTFSMSDTTVVPCPFANASRPRARSRMSPCRWCTANSSSVMRTSSSRFKVIMTVPTGPSQAPLHRWDAFSSAGKIWKNAAWLPVTGFERGQDSGKRPLTWPGWRRAHFGQAKRARAMELDQSIARTEFLELPSRPLPVKSFADLAGQRATTDRRVLHDSRLDVVYHFSREPLAADTHMRRVARAAGGVKCVIWSGGHWL